MKVRIAGSAALLSLYATAAIACSTPSYVEAGLTIHGDRLAERMVGAASRVDLVEIALITPWDPKAFFAEERAEAITDARPDWIAQVGEDYDAYEEQYRLFGASTVTLRVVERLKGSGEDTFTIGAFVASDDAFGLSSLTDRISPEGPLPTGEELYDYPFVDLARFEGSGSCAAPLVVVPGQTYIVLRDVDGALLKGAIPATYAARQIGPNFDGPSFEAVRTQNDVWLDAVRAATSR